LGKGEGIGRMRGKFQVFRNIPLMPTFHPAYLLRNQALSEKRKVWEDMLQVMEKLQMEINDKQRAYFVKQKKARRDTRLLLFYFFLAVILVVVITYFIVAPGIIGSRSRWSHRVG